jgi:hypothetical protein
MRRQNDLLMAFHGSKTKSFKREAAYFLCNRKCSEQLLLLLWQSNQTELPQWFFNSIHETRNRSCVFAHWFIH